MNERNEPPHTIVQHTELCHCSNPALEWKPWWYPRESCNFCGGSGVIHRLRIERRASDKRAARKARQASLWSEHQ